MKADRVGLGWRPELAAGILENQGMIDVLEVIADDFFDASRREVRALQTLASQVPVVLHGIGMGLATCAKVDQELLDKMARLVEHVRPEGWSEHLAFVRADGIEIGHLAAPPRTRQNIQSTVENVGRAEKTVGSKPSLENIATLIDPPGSELSELEWICKIVELSGCDLLLDLHNVFANGVNLGYDPAEFMHQLPLKCTRMIHIAGGMPVEALDNSVRVLDDHLHDVPDPVFDLLEGVAKISPNPLTVILERDGAYPPTSQLLDQLERARQAIRRGRVLRMVAEEISA